MAKTKKYNPKKVLVIFMSAFFALAIGFVYLQSSSTEKSKDPRVLTARKLYSNYNDLTSANKYDDIINLMDSIQDIYQSVPHYRRSYEVGVLHNNRCAAYLSLYLQQLQHGITVEARIPRDSLLYRSEECAQKSIEIYKSWLSRFENQSENELRENIQAEFLNGLEKYTLNEQRKFLDHRLKSIQKALKEVNRRLSIAYTNLGIVYRHREQYKTAMEYYTKALDLWDKNLTAENNRNILLGKPLKQHRVIDKFMPAE